MDRTVGSDSHGEQSRHVLCYQLYYDGAIAGFNGTDKRVYLYKDRDCQGGARAYVDPRVGWQDSTNVYYSFDFVP
ncbi:hypothetical protein [Streptomyces sp. NRRL S-646]|uniref:hypothetical protein n=1 Tax=Streptomyces sp. NRRL S-646 TaxID=1463917 RepID=UPI0004C6E780|nr:hypothetical protein [Streptomyces sp. NRRL S-646]